VTRPADDSLTFAEELTDFSVYYSQGVVDAITADLKAGKRMVTEAEETAGVCAMIAGDCPVAEGAGNVRCRGRVWVRVNRKSSGRVSPHCPATWAPRCLEGSQP